MSNFRKKNHFLLLLIKNYIREVYVQKQGKTWIFGYFLYT
jgi:hypothetical protein